MGAAVGSSLQCTNSNDRRLGVSLITSRLLVSLITQLAVSGGTHSGCLQDFIEQTGYFQGTPGRDLTAWEWNLLISDTDEQVQAAVGILVCAFSKWHVENTLAFVRQGRSGFDPQKTGDWRAFVGGDQTLQQHILGYLNCIKTYLRFIDNDPSLFWNQHRPNIYCEPI